MCRMFTSTNVESVDQVRVALFSKSANPAALPPTKDALVLNIKRAHCQALVWKQANRQDPTLPDPVGMGWTKKQ